MADTALGTLYDQFLAHFKGLAGARSNLGAAALFQLESACRVQEMITVSYGQVESDTTVFLVASKNSNSRYVTLEGIEYFLQRSLQNHTHPFIPIDYHQYSEFLRREGINYKLSTSLRRSPTHILRYSKLHRMSLDGSTDVEVQAFAGHKSLRTTEEYLAATLE